MKFLATEIKADGEYSVDFDAPDWPAAERYCEQNSYTLLGEAGAQIPASETFGRNEADMLIAHLNEGEGATKH